MRDAGQEVAPFRAVVVVSAPLHLGPGSETTFGVVAPDQEVTVSRRAGPWLWAVTDTPPLARGWIQEDRLGCRVLVETDLRAELPPGEKGIQVRPGALVSILGQRGATLEVETQGPLVFRGELPRDRCGIGKSFVPTLPRDGQAHRLIRLAFLETPLLREPPQLPLGQRFTVLSREGDRAYGRTDGPVIIYGRIDPNALERDLSTPFDRLAEPLGYTHEVLLDGNVRRSPAGQILARLKGGTPVNLLDQSGRWTRIATYGPVRLEGWIEEPLLRRISLDYNELEPGARQRRHSPEDRDRPRVGDPS